MEVNEDLGWRVPSPEARPLLFEPDIQWNIFEGPNIIHDY